MAYTTLQEGLRAAPKVWLVTGVAGFIGSNLLETLLRLGQRVIGLDNFSAGHRRNLDEVKRLVSDSQWEGFTFIEGDVCDVVTCREICSGVNYVLHQAALGSVPGSLADPLGAHASNVTGFLNLLLAAQEAGVRRFVYASSCAVYGDLPELPKREETPVSCLSPYAATKLIDEIYAEVFARCFRLSCVGLRYFNVFGPRQDPHGAYAAVIPKWISAMLNKEVVTINGDGETSRDFCYIANVVQANLLAANGVEMADFGSVLNVAVGEQTTLNQLLEMLRRRLEAAFPYLRDFTPVYAPFREGDVRHSHADITKARVQLGYKPSHRTEDGIFEALDWYLEDYRTRRLE